MTTFAKRVKPLFIVPFLVICFAQSPPSVEELLARLANDATASQAAGLLGEHGTDARTIPALKSRFISAGDKSTKQSIAISLLRLEVRDAIYFEYLASFAAEAVDSDAPSMFLYNGRQQQVGGENPEFKKWCLEHGKEVAEEIQKHYYVYAADLLALGTAHDSRAAPIFRKGLESNNSMVVFASVLSLGALGDPADIEPIIRAADQANENIDGGVAKALSYYRSEREAIAKRLQGSRLYESFQLAVKVQDQLDSRAAGKNAMKGFRCAGASARWETPRTST